MKVKLLAIGKTDNEKLVELIADYEKRLSHYINFTFEIVPDIKHSKNLTTVQQKEAEGELLLKKYTPAMLLYYSMKKENNILLCNLPISFKSK